MNVRAFVSIHRQLNNAMARFAFVGGGSDQWGYRR